MLILRDDAMKKICSHAQMEYPKGCCGIMLGKRLGEQRYTYRIIPTKNVLDESQNTKHFMMDSLEIVKIELLAEKENLEIVGFYHSHPDQEAVASDEDMHYMIAGYSYPIISVKNGTSVSMNSYADEKEENILIKEK